MFQLQNIFFNGFYLNNLVTPSNISGQIFCRITIYAYQQQIQQQQEKFIFKTKQFHDFLQMILLFFHKLVHLLIRI